MRKFGLDKVHDAIVGSEANKILGVVLVEEGESDWSTSINAYMLAEGLAALSQEAIESERTPEEVLEWTAF